MKKVILGILGLMLMFSLVSATTYYVGDPTIYLSPQLVVQGSYPIDDATHHTYFACYSALDDDTNVVSMERSGLCEDANPEIQATEANVGDHSYTVAIYYNSRAWNQVTHQWETTSEGVDNNETFDFTIESIPTDDLDVTSWISGLLGSIQNFFCTHFGLFCPSESNWIYQEDADSYSTSGLWNDGDWDTYSIVPSETYYNYTIPLNLVSAKWKIKEGNINGDTINITIPDECLEGDKLMFHSYVTIPWEHYCWSYTTSSYSVPLCSLGDDCANFYEEGVWWEIA